MTVIQMVIVGMIVVILATLTLAVLSYGAFKVRERRAAPRRGHGGAAGAAVDGSPLFFERVRIAPPADEG